MKNNSFIIRNLILVAIREKVSELLALTRNLLKDIYIKNSYEINFEKINQNFLRIGAKTSPNVDKVILVDHFPIYRWLIPNLVIANYLARQTNSRITVFSFRLLNRQNRQLYKSMLVNQILYVKLSFRQNLELICEYQKLLKYLKRNKLIEYKINGISIGLDIYESILRSGRPTVSLNEIQTFRIAYLGLKQYVFFRRFFEEGKIKSVIVSHDNYIGPGLLAHMAFFYKVEVILANLYSITSPTREFQLYESFSRYQIYLENLDINEIKQGMNWSKLELAKRLSGTIGAGLKYQKKSAFSGELLSRQTSKNNVTKVLLLTHDFYDNPHGYAKMTFDDFLLWMEDTAKISIETNFEWYVKPHRDYSYKELEVLKSFLFRNENFKMIDPDTSFHQLKAEGVDFIVTCYGTVGHELPLLGFTVVNASYNPHIAFDFNVTARTHSEYENILRNIEKFRIKDINAEDIYRFYFVHHRVVQNISYLGISTDVLDSISEGKLNTIQELDFLLDNLETISTKAIAHLISLKKSGRVFGFEDFLRSELQLKRQYDTSISYSE